VNEVLAQYKHVVDVAQRTPKNRRGVFEAALVALAGEVERLEVAATLASLEREVVARAVAYHAALIGGDSNSLAVAENEMFAAIVRLEEARRNAQAEAPTTPTSEVERNAVVAQACRKWLNATNENDPDYLKADDELAAVLEDTYPEWRAALGEEGHA
jgi:hypothetical protein